MGHARRRFVVMATALSALAVVMLVRAEAGGPVRKSFNVFSAGPTQFAALRRSVWGESYSLLVTHCQHPMRARAEAVTIGKVRFVVLD